MAVIFASPPGGIPRKRRRRCGRWLSAGLPLCEENIQKYLNRRKPGQNPYSTPRKEDDAVEILSGIFEGHTTGTPISMMVWNKSQRSADYSEIANYYRPGHADMAYDLKYGFRDYRGGGRSSAGKPLDVWPLVPSPPQFWTAWEFPFLPIQSLSAL